MSLKGKVTGSGDWKPDLPLRMAAEYVDVTTVLSPLFKYMQWRDGQTPDEVYRCYVAPSDIHRMKLFPPDGPPVTGTGAICGAIDGPWDRLTRPVSNHYLSRSIRAFVEDGQPWSETAIYEHPKYRDDPERARQRCEKIEGILESVAERGYHQQPPTGRPEQTESREWVDDVYVGDEIIVGLGRNGKPIHLKNGRHRLVVAQVLDIDYIPVIVSLYHPKAAGNIPSDAIALSPPPE